MRVIAGSARRVSLKTLEGMNTRPTQIESKRLFLICSSMIWQTAHFWICLPEVVESELRRSAVAQRQRYLWNKMQMPVQIVRENLKATRLEDRAVVMHTDALTALKRLEGKYRFDYIFMDPPYNHELERQMLEYLTGSELIDKQSTIIIEASLETSFDYLESLGLFWRKIKHIRQTTYVCLSRRMKWQQQFIRAVLIRLPLDI